MANTGILGIRKTATPVSRTGSKATRSDLGSASSASANKDRLPAPKSTDKAAGQSSGSVKPSVNGGVSKITNVVNQHEGGAKITKTQLDVIQEYLQSIPLADRLAQIADSIAKTGLLPPGFFAKPNPADDGETIKIVEHSTRTEFYRLEASDHSAALDAQSQSPKTFKSKLELYVIEFIRGAADAYAKFVTQYNKMLSEYRNLENYTYTPIKNSAVKWQSVIDGVKECVLDEPVAYDITAFVKLCEAICNGNSVSTTCFRFKIVSFGEDNGHEVVMEDLFKELDLNVNRVMALERTVIPMIKESGFNLINTLSIEEDVLPGLNLKELEMDKSQAKKWVKSVLNNKTFRRHIKIEDEQDQWRSGELKKFMEGALDSIQEFLKWSRAAAETSITSLQTLRGRFAQLNDSIKISFDDTEKATFTQTSKICNELMGYVRKGSKSSRSEAAITGSNIYLDEAWYSEVLFQASQKLSREKHSVYLAYARFSELVDIDNAMDQLNKTITGMIGFFKSLDVSLETKGLTTLKKRMQLDLLSALDILDTYRGVKKTPSSIGTEVAKKLATIQGYIAKDSTAEENPLLTGKILINALEIQEELKKFNAIKEKLRVHMYGIKVMVLNQLSNQVTDFGLCGEIIGEKDPKLSSKISSEESQELQAKLKMALITRIIRKHGFYHHHYEKLGNRHENDFLLNYLLEGLRCVSEEQLLKVYAFLKNTRAINYPKQTQDDLPYDKGMQAVKRELVMGFESKDCPQVFRDGEVGMEVLVLTILLKKLYHTSFNKNETKYKAGDSDYINEILTKVRDRGSENIGLFSIRVGTDEYATKVPNIPGVRATADVVAATSGSEQSPKSGGGAKPKLMSPHHRRKDSGFSGGQ